jgi:hypothetical protein
MFLTAGVGNGKSAGEAFGYRTNGEKIKKWNWMHACVEWIQVRLACHSLTIHFGPLQVGILLLILDHFEVENLGGHVKTMGIFSSCCHCYSSVASCASRIFSWGSLRLVSLAARAMAIFYWWFLWRSNRLGAWDDDDDDGRLDNEEEWRRGDRRPRHTAGASSFLECCHGWEKKESRNETGSSLVLGFIQYLLGCPSDSKIWRLFQINTANICKFFWQIVACAWGSQQATRK